VPPELPRTLINAAPPEIAIGPVPELTALTLMFPEESRVAPVAVIDAAAAIVMAVLAVIAKVPASVTAKFSWTAPVALMDAPAGLEMLPLTVSPPPRIDSAIAPPPAAVVTPFWVIVADVVVPSALTERMAKLTGPIVVAPVWVM